MPLNSTTEQARASGIDPAEDIRQELVRLRDEAINQAAFDWVVILTHAIWWLAKEEGK